MGSGVILIRLPATKTELANSLQITDSAQIVGPLRSLAWLAGLDGLIEAIDHPAYTIRDEIEVVPQGAVPVNWHWEEGHVPPSIWREITG